MERQVICLESVQRGGLININININDDMTIAVSIIIIMIMIMVVVVLLLRIWTVSIVVALGIFPETALIDVDSMSQEIEEGVIIIISTMTTTIVVVVDTPNEHKTKIER